MKQTYSKPMTVRTFVSAESEFMDCSVRVNVSMTVEPYHDATFSDSNKTWTIGFGEPGVE